MSRGKGIEVLRSTREIDPPKNCDNCTCANCVYKTCPSFCGAVYLSKLERSIRGYHCRQWNERKCTNKVGVLGDD